MRIPRLRTLTMNVRVRVRCDHEWQVITTQLAKLGDYTY